MVDSTAQLKVAVNGASGFIGSHVVAALAAAGQHPMALVRKANPTLESLGATVVSVDMHDEAALTEGMRGCTRLVHLIGSIAPPKGTSLDDLHGGMAARFFRAAKAAGVEKVVMVTALGSGPDGKSQYHRTKWAMEEALRASGLTSVVVRPSLIVGRHVGTRDSKLVRRYLDLIETKKKVPLVLGGRNLVQPLDVGDLAAVIAAAVARPDWDGRTVEIGGPEVLTTRAFVERLMQAIGIQKPCVTLPGWLAWLAASVLERVQTTPLLSRDQLRIAAIDGDCPDNAITSEFGIEPLGLDDALAVYRAEGTGKQR